MGMELQHEFTVPASIEETWAAFNDIESVAQCFPGATVTGVAGDTFTGSCKVKLGPIALVYNGTGTFVEKDEAARRMVIDAKGKDKRGNGTAGAHVTATMTQQGTSTRVEVLTDLNITGKPAQFGRGVMQDVSDKLLGQFTACLEQKVGDASAAAAADRAEASGPPRQNPPTPSPPAPDPAAPVVGDAGGDAGGDTAVGATGDGSNTVRELRPTASAAGQSAPHASNRPGNDEALDLGATVLPVLARAYWKQLAGVLVVLLVLRRLLRRG